MEIGDNDASVYTLAELQASGFNQNDHHGLKHTGSSPSLLMTYESHRDYRNDYGRKLEVIQKYNGLELITHIQFYDGIQTVKFVNEVVNHSGRSTLWSMYLLCIDRDHGADKGPRDKTGLLYSA